MDNQKQNLDYIAVMTDKDLLEEIVRRCIRLRKIDILKKFCSEHILLSKNEIINAIITEYVDQMVIHHNDICDIIVAIPEHYLIDCKIYAGVLTKLYTENRLHLIIDTMPDTKSSDTMSDTKSSDTKSSDTKPSILNNCINSRQNLPLTLAYVNSVDVVMKLIELFVTHSAHTNPEHIVKYLFSELEPTDFCKVIDMCVDSKYPISKHIYHPVKNFSGEDVIAILTKLLSYDILPPSMYILGIVMNHDTHALQVLYDHNINIKDYLVSFTTGHRRSPDIDMILNLLEKFNIDLNDYLNYRYWYNNYYTDSEQ